MKRTILFCALSVTVLAHASPLQPTGAVADPLKEYRQCGAPVRLADGSIRRRSDVITAYRKLHPCPATGKTTGACVGWSLNHTVPLASGGCDAVVNLSWQPNSIKSCARPECIDRWERTYYGDPYGIVTLPQAAPASGATP